MSQSGRCSIFFFFKSHSWVTGDVWGAMQRRGLGSWEALGRQGKPGDLVRRGSRADDKKEKWTGERMCPSPSHTAGRRGMGQMAQESVLAQGDAGWLMIPRDRAGGTSHSEGWVRKILRDGCVSTWARGRSEAGPQPLHSLLWVMYTVLTPVHPSRSVLQVIQWGKFSIWTTYGSFFFFFFFIATCENFY